jgi:hypothetical protein
MSLNFVVDGGEVQSEGGVSSAKDNSWFHQLRHGLQGNEKIWGKDKELNLWSLPMMTKQLVYCSTLYFYHCFRVYSFYLLKAKFIIKQYV